MKTCNIFEYLKPISKKVTLSDLKPSTIGIDAQDWLVKAVRLFLKEPLSSTSFEKIYNFFKSKLIEIFKTGNTNQGLELCLCFPVAYILSCVLWKINRESKPTNFRSIRISLTRLILRN